LRDNHATTIMPMPRHRIPILIVAPFPSRSPRYTLIGPIGCDAVRTRQRRPVLVLLTEQPFFRLPIGASALLPGDDVLAGPHARHRDAGSRPSRAAANEAGGVSPALAPIPGSIKPGADFFSPSLPPDKTSTDLPIGTLKRDFHPAR
jgi:hypothetical protein